NSPERVEESDMDERVDREISGVIIAARWGDGCGIEGGGDVVMVLEAVAAAARVGTEVVGGAWWRVA
nr:hypothetical protein [Tanacetum cinerariifolium]